VTAAFFNAPEVALKCLRRWPDLTAEVLRECSSGCLNQRLQYNRASGGAPQDVIAIHAVTAAASALQSNGALIVANVHICGEGYAGKTMTRQALMKSLNSSSSLLLPSQLPNIHLVNGRTRGMVSEALVISAWLTTDPVRVLLHDYGGQEEFQANHAAHLAAPNSVYLLVVPLWDVRPKPDQTDVPAAKLMNRKELKTRFEIWLKIIASVASEGIEKAQCITVLNFRNQFEAACGGDWKRELQDIVEQLQVIQGRFSAKLTFPIRPVAINSINSRSVHAGVVPILRSSIKCLTGQPVPLAPAVGTVLEHMESSGRWPLFSSEEETQTLLREAINARYRPGTNLVCNCAVADEVVNTIAEMTQDLLEARRDIIVSPPRYRNRSTQPEQSTQRTSINRPNWLTEQVLGSLFDTGKVIRGVGLRENLLSCKEIAKKVVEAEMKADAEARKVSRISSVATSTAAKVDPVVLGRLLHHIGACIPVTVSADSSHYILTVTRATEGAEQYYFPAFSDTEMPSTSDSKTVTVFENVIRRYTVDDVQASMIVPGYYPSLFIAVASLTPAFQPEHPKPVEKLLWVYKNGMVLEVDAKYRVIIRGDAINTSFDLEVEVISSDYPGSAFDEMCNVRRLIVDAEGWRANMRLHLIESCVHPIYGDAPDGVDPRAFLPIEAKLRGGEELGPYDDLFYHGKRRGNDRIAQLELELNKLRQEFRATVVRMLLLQLLQAGRISATTGDVGDSGVEDDITDAEIDSLWKDAEAAVLESNRDVNDLRRTLADECKQLVEHGLRGMEVNLAKATKRLEQLQNTQDNLVYSVYDLPFLAELVPAQPTGKWVDYFRRKAFEVFRLHFYCPVCGKRAETGKNGKGYKFCVTRDWVKKARTGLETAGVVLELLSLASGLPIPRVTELIVNLIPTAECISVVDALKKMQQDCEQLANADSESTVGLKSWRRDEAAGIVLTRAHVAAVRSLLIAAGDKIPPEQVGLVKATCTHTGECAWVCHDKCKSVYDAGGAEVCKLKVSTEDP
jgi:hypothetical protein